MKKTAVIKKQGFGFNVGLLLCDLYLEFTLFFPLCYFSLCNWAILSMYQPRLGSYPSLEEWHKFQDNQVYSLLSFKL